MDEPKKYVVSVSKAVDFLMTPMFTTSLGENHRISQSLGKSYWLGLIRCNNRTVARTGKHKTRKAAKSEVEKLLRQIKKEANHVLES